MSLHYYLLWLAPIFSLLIGYLLSSVKMYRQKRYISYLVILFVAFLFDLTGLSFTYNVLDVALLFAVTLILSEIYWKIFRFKNRVLLILCIILGSGLFVIAFKQWIFGGPANVRLHLESQIVSEHNCGAEKYIVKESEIVVKKKHIRTFSLNRFIKNMPLEKLIGSYAVPEGYYKAEFRFRWTIKDNILSVDLIGDKDILWTLGEGL